MKPRLRPRKLQVRPVPERTPAVLVSREVEALYRLDAETLHAILFEEAVPTTGELADVVAADCEYTIVTQNNTRVPLKLMKCLEILVVQKQEAAEGES